MITAIFICLLLLLVLQALELGKTDAGGGTL